MTILAQHLAVILVDHVKRDGGKQSIFLNEIAGLLWDRYNIAAPDGLVNDAIKILTEIGGCRNLVSPLTGAFCRFDSDGANYYFGSWPSFSNEWGGDEEAEAAYAERRDTVRKAYPIVETYFEADRKWVERVIEKLSGMDLSADYGLDNIDANEGIPASDRVVSLEDNQPAANEVRSELETFERELRESNEAGDILGDDREVALAEVSILRSILAQVRVRAAATMAYAKRTLGWIAEKGAAAAIGEAAKRILTMIIGLFS